MNLERGQVEGEMTPYERLETGLERTVAHRIEQRSLSSQFPQALLQSHSRAPSHVTFDGTYLYATLLVT